MTTTDGDAEVARYRAAAAQQEARAESARVEALLAGSPEGRALLVEERRMALEVERGRRLAEGLAVLAPGLAGLTAGGALLLEELAREAGVSVGGLARGAYIVGGRLELTASTQLALARRAGIEVEYEWSTDSTAVVATATIGGKVRRERIVVAEQAARGKSTEWQRDPRGMAEYAAARRLLRRWSSLPLGTLEEPGEEPGLVSVVTVAPEAVQVAAAEVRQISEAPAPAPPPPPSSVAAPTGEPPRRRQRGEP